MKEKAVMTETVLQPRGRAAERLLLYGPQGAGKTKAIADILNRALGPGQTAYIIDTDNSWARFVESGNYPNIQVREEWEDGGWVSEWCVEDGRVVLFHVRSWEEEEHALTYAWANAGRGDWVVLDSATHPWDHVQSWYIERVHGSDVPEFLIEARIKRAQADKASDGGNSAMLVEWVYLNKVWSKAFLTPFVNARCHVAVTAEAKALRTDDRGDAKDVRDLYGVVGFKPDAQRRLGANAQTVMFMEQAKRGSEVYWVMTTVKDREREMVRRVEWGDFAQEYLFKVAGWRPRKMESE